MDARMVATVLLALAVGACGHTEYGNSTASSSSSTSVGGWNAADACATLDKVKVGALLKSDVTSNDPGPITDHEGAGMGGTSSQCSYMLADGRNVLVQTLKAPKDPGVPAMVAAIHDELKSVGDGSARDIAGAGKATIWAERSRVMYAVYGQGRYAAVTVRKIMPGGTKPTEQQIQADELALLHAISA